MLGLIVVMVGPSSWSSALTNQKTIIMYVRLPANITLPVFFWMVTLSNDHGMFIMLLLEMEEGRIHYTTPTNEGGGAMTAHHLY